MSPIRPVKASVVHFLVVLIPYAAALAAILATHPK